MVQDFGYGLVLKTLGNCCFHWEVYLGLSLSLFTSLPADQHVNTFYWLLLGYSEQSDMIFTKQTLLDESFQTDLVWLNDTSDYFYFLKR